ncbi:MAG TPA: Hsp20/alpha crystallin family protein [Anaerolineae bacterium]
MGHTDRDDPYDRLKARIDQMYQDMISPGRWVVVQYAHAWRPPTDVFENDEAMVVRIEVAGMRETDFTVTLSDQLLIVTGFRQDPSPKVAYHQMEVRYGEFRVEVYLHWAIGESSVQAIYDNGFLQVYLPKARKQHIHIIESGD